MANLFYEVEGIRVLECSIDGPTLGSSHDASDLIGDASSNGAGFVILPADRIAPKFFQLRTGLAGEVLQKFVNYGLRIAIIGDISAFSSESAALRDLIKESNRGNSIWFLADQQEVVARLTKKNSAS